LVVALGGGGGSYGYRDSLRGKVTEFLKHKERQSIFVKGETF